MLGLYTLYTHYATVFAVRYSQVITMIKQTWNTSMSVRNADTTSAVSPLPAAATRLTLSRCRHTMIVDTLTSARLQQAFQLVCDAADRADNVGVDEYPTIEHFEQLIRRSSAAVSLRAADDGRLAGIIIVTPCIYARSPRPTLCTAVIVTSTSLCSSTSDAWRDVIDVAMDTARQLPERYSACVTNVFVTCVSQMLALREAGFMITACIPHAGKVAGFPGYVSNYVMYKDLGTVPQPPVTILDTFDSRRICTNDLTSLEIN